MARLGEDESLEISSKLSLLYKTVVPAVAAAVVIWLIWAVLTPWVIAYCLGLLVLVGSAVRFLIRLKRIVVQDESFVVDNYRVKIVIPYRDIKRIRQYTGTFCFTTIFLTRRSRFGRRIYFMNRWKPVTVGRYHPDVIFLRQKSGLGDERGNWRAEIWLVVRVLLVMVIWGFMLEGLKRIWEMLSGG